MREDVRRKQWEKAERAGIKRARLEAEGLRSIAKRLLDERPLFPGLETEFRGRAGNYVLQAIALERRANEAERRLTGAA
jgi:hypothetical protein